MKYFDAKRQLANSRRSGISLMEVLISIGVIALGIFGVASLIPVAQFKVAEGTTNDRLASLGPSAAAQFRVHGMGNPSNWHAKGGGYRLLGFNATSSEEAADNLLVRKAYCIDPLGIAENFASPGQVLFFPARLDPTVGQQFGMQRLTLKNMVAAPAQPGPELVETALARRVFHLSDELVFERPDDQGLQPRRQFFVDNASGTPLASVSKASLSWFATVCPMAIVPTGTTEEYMLSIVILQNRAAALLSLPQTTTANADEQLVVGINSRFAGEVRLPMPRQSVPAGTFGVAELKTGDWLLLSKLAYEGAQQRIFRWVQIIGDSEPESDGFRSFTVSNDDFIRPGAANTDQVPSAILVKGVKSVYERTIRIDRASLVTANQTAQSGSL